MNTIAVIGEKENGTFTIGGTQLMRQARYLEKYCFKNKDVIVLISELFLFKDWYIKEMQEIIDNVEGVKIFAMQ
jgi:hypothetical protein